MIKSKMSGKLSEKLKVKTAEQHRSLEREFISHIREIKTDDDYIRFLKIIYGYYQPLEERINSHSSGRLPDMEDRRKVSWISDDIEVLGGTLTGIRVCNDLPNVRSLYGSLGCMYVLEGSTLGGQVISKMIGKLVDVRGREIFRFFSSYGSDTMPKWAIFKEIIDQIPTEAHAEVIAAAKATFVKFENWIKQYVF